MINKQEILEELKSIRNKTELLANPLYNDFGGSHFWSDIDKKLEEVETQIKKHKEIYHW